MRRGPPISLLDCPSSYPFDEVIQEIIEQQRHRCAREQGARSLELRVATSLARLLRSQGKPKEASALLASVYSSFDEGFETADLSQAKVLIDAIG